MEVGVGDLRGGIRGLTQFLAEHGEAVEYDLLTMGLRLEWLGSHRLSWRDLLVIVKNAPPESAILRAQRGDAALYGVTDYLLVSVINSLRMMSWQLGGDPKAPKPDLFTVPGMKDPSDMPTLRGDVMPVEELRRRLGWDVEGR